jgi:hypothetical protein
VDLPTSSVEHPWLDVLRSDSQPSSPSSQQNWPTIDATMQTGALGGISFGKGASAGATFVGYAFTVEGVRYAGFSAVYGDEVHVNDLPRRLAGSVIPIRYDPSDPNISFLVESTDPRFGGLAVTQNSEYLSQSPAFDLQDALR